MDPDGLAPGSCTAVGRAVGLDLRRSEKVLAVDTADCAPIAMVRFVALNPFHVDRSWQLRITGSPLRAHSVEAVWQGSKLVDGVVDEGMYRSTPSKRPPEAERGAGYSYEDSTFRVAGEEVGLVEARYVLYLPAYLQVLGRHLPGSAAAEIAGTVAAGGRVVFYDWDDNFDIDDPSAAFSHSALLAMHFAGTLGPVVDRARQLARRRGLVLDAASDQWGAS